MKELLSLLALAGFTLSMEAADTGLAGRWASAPDSPVQVKLSIAKVGTLYSISHSWMGPSAMCMETLNYAATGLPAQGALELDPKEKPTGSAPHKLGYVLKGDTLALKVAEGDFAGEHRLTRASLTTPAAAKALAQARAKAKKSPPLTTARLLGTWQTEEDAELQAGIDVRPGPGEGELSLSQSWGDQMAQSMSSNLVYQLVQQDGRRSLQAKETKSSIKAPPELSLLQFEIDGDALIVTLDSGHHAGTHLLHKKTP